MSFKRYLAEGGEAMGDEQDLMASPNMFGADATANPNPQKNPTGGGSLSPFADKLVSTAKQIDPSLEPNLVAVLSTPRPIANRVQAMQVLVDPKQGKQRFSDYSKLSEKSKVALGTALSTYPSLTAENPSFSELIPLIALADIYKATEELYSLLSSANVSFMQDVNEMKKAVDSFTLSSSLQRIVDKVSMLKPLLFISDAMTGMTNSVKIAKPTIQESVQASKQILIGFQQAGDPYPGGTINTQNPEEILSRIHRILHLAVRFMNIAPSKSLLSISNVDNNSVEFEGMKQRFNLSQAGSKVNPITRYLGNNTSYFKEGGKMNNMDSPRKMKVVRMAEGGVMEGPSHEEGGIPVITPEGEVLAEMEGQELILSVEATEAMDSMGRDFIESGDEDILRDIGAYYVQERIKQEAINPSADGIDGLDPNMGMGMEDDMGMEEEMMPMEDDMPMARYGMKTDKKMMAKGGKGLYDNINAKKERIANGSGERMRNKGEKGDPSDSDFKNAAKTAKMSKGGKMSQKDYLKSLNKF